MAPSPVARIFAITLSIVIAEYQVHGFSVHRRDAGAKPTDLTSQESFMLQVKNDLKRPNDIKEGKGSKSIDDKGTHETTMDYTVDSTYSDSPFTSDTELPKSTSKIVSEMNENLNGTTSIFEIEKYTTILDEMPADDSIDATKTTQSQDTTKDTFTTQIPTLDDKQDYAISTVDKEATFSTVTVDSLELSTGDIVPTDVDDETIKTTYAENSHYSTVFEPTEYASTVQIENTDSYLNAEDKKTSETVNDVTTDATGTATETLLEETDALDHDTTKELSVISDVYTITPSPQDNSKTDSELTTPQWKKYVTIDRKRVSNADEAVPDTVKDENMVKSETAMVQITSHESSNEDLSISSLPSTNSEFVSFTGAESDSTGTEKTIFVIDTDSDLKTKGTVESKRAGFIDLGKTSSMYEETTKTTIEKDKDDADTVDNEPQELKGASGLDTQSQLAEDAIKEELLREQVLSAHQENANRYLSGPLEANIDKESGDEHGNSTAVQPATEDTLSVQPINTDRRTTLYTVSPNYKPMKKIDVQPPKSFVRDPDDNSWRNESISSLGIVFKPKNASKSFKEVLKNKTETEFNQLQDKDNKDDVPDLRVRLEKIAEFRKKKKKTYKSGEVVYTDYEESGSAEHSTSTTSTAKTDILNDILNTHYYSGYTKSTPETTTAMTKDDDVSINEYKSITKEDFFKNIGLDILTTQKPKKYFNAAEYYDTTDDYDEYAKLSKIDIKKFTRKLEPTQPSQPTATTPAPTTRHMRPAFPDRRPTVQYFPPRPKVNIDEYDDHFHKKVNYYTPKEFTFTIPTDPETERVATESPELAPAPEATPAPYSSQTFAHHPAAVTDHVTNHLYPARPAGYVVNDGEFNGGSYVIKHYKDFLSDAAKDADYERAPDLAFTEAPADAESTQRAADVEYDDYDAHFRRQVLSRFVDNFNRNSERFKVDFPVLYNSSVVHRPLDGSGVGVASSSAFMRRLYGTGRSNGTVELSPAYELHYYVPEQEERQEAEARAPLL